MLEAAQIAVDDVVKGPVRCMADLGFVEHDDIAPVHERTAGTIEDRVRLEFQLAQDAAH
jgi:hypothetical protein